MQTIGIKAPLYILAHSSCMQFHGSHCGILVCQGSTQKIYFENLLIPLAATCIFKPYSHIWHYCAKINKLSSGTDCSFGMLPVFGKHTTSYCTKACQIHILLQQNPDPAPIVEGSIANPVSLCFICLGCMLQTSVDCSYIWPPTSPHQNR